MNRLAPPILALGVGLLVASATACGDPSDVIAVGDLCLPASADCPESVELTRDDRGRNGLEFTLRYRGDETDQAPTTEVRATTDAVRARPGGEDRSSDLDDRDQTDDGRHILYAEQFTPGAGDDIQQQLDGYHLTIAESFRLELRCVDGDCDHTLEYLHFAEAIECIDENDCSRTEVCEQVYGRCASCQDDTDCEGDQQCRRDLGRCYPGDAAGCQHSPTGSSPARGPVLVVTLLIAGLLARRYRRRLAYLGVALAAAGLVAASPAVADAETGASLHAGGGMRILTGDVGDLTRPGWGINVNQQLRWHRLGTMVEISTHSFGFDDTARGSTALSGYGITVGPRIFFPITATLPMTRGEQSFEFVAAVDYTHWNVAENRLAGSTGLGLRHHSVGPTAGVSWKWGGLAITARSGYSHIFGWPGGMLSFDVTVGIGP